MEKDTRKRKIMTQEKPVNQFKNYKEAIKAAYPDIIGEDGFAEPDFDGLDVIRYVDEKKLTQIFNDSDSLPELKMSTKQALDIAIEDEKRKHEEWQEQKERREFEEQEKMDAVYAKYAVDGDIQNIDPSYFKDATVEGNEHSSNLAQLKKVSDLYNLNLKQEDYDKFSMLTKEQCQSVLNEVISQHQPNSEHTSTNLEADTPDFDAF